MPLDKKEVVGERGLTIAIIYPASKLTLGCEPFRLVSDPLTTPNTEVYSLAQASQLGSSAPWSRQISCDSGWQCLVGSQQHLGLYTLGVNSQCPLQFMGTRRLCTSSAAALGRRRLLSTEVRCFDS